MPMLQKPIDTETGAATTAGLRPSSRRRPSRCRLNYRIARASRQTNRRMDQSATTEAAG